MLDEVTIPRILVAGAGTGTGKTTVALGLTAALSRRGRRVQTYKVGPDLVDSAYLAHVSGRPCRNLDAWLLGPEGVRRALARGSVDADCAVVEGALGIFDCHGLRPDGDQPGAYGFPGSSAEVARLVRAPVVLVLDVGAMGETAAAIALGVRQADPRLRIIGVLLNNVESDYHGRLVEDAVWTAATLPVLGALPRIAAMAIPEWRLGLVPLAENSSADQVIQTLATAVERHCDLDLLERLMAAAEPLPVTPRPPLRPAAEPVRLAVAFDDAFTFYYPENLELLEEAGAEIVPFSPLEDRALPAGIDGLYLSGRFADVVAARLAANRSMAEAIARAHAHGVPIYAECGGLLYLARSLRTHDDEVHPMVGLLPVDAAMNGESPSAGYRELRVMADSLLGGAGTRLRGHEFHLNSVTEAVDCLSPAYSVHDCGGEPLGCEGWIRGALVASLVHLHFGQDPAIAERFVARMLAARRTRHGEPALV